MAAPSTRSVSSPMPSPARPLADTIRDELIDQWMGDTPKRIAIVPLCALLVYAVLHGTAPETQLLPWLLLVGGASAWRYQVYRRYWRSADQAQARVAEGRRTGVLSQMVASVTLLGLSWGMSMVLGHHYSTQSPTVLATVGVITAGMAVVTIGGMFPRAGLMMTLGIFAPFVLWSFLLGSLQAVLLACGALVYISILVVWSRGLYRNVVNTMLLRHENDELVRELSRAKESAEQANLEKSRFLAAASHDLRQPMQGLWLFVGNLRQQWGRPEAAGILDHIENSLDAMRALFDSLLNISQLDSGGVKPRLQDVAIQSVLDRIEAEFSTECDRRMLRFKVWPSAAWVRTDPAMLDRILLNFVSNAVKYTPSGGGILVGCRRRGNQLEIQTWDSGLGIAPEHHVSIFDEFVQLNNPERDRNKGLGLGLAISRRLATLLDATLRLRSAPGRGSMFSVTVPLATASAHALPDAAILSAPSLQGLRLAFVDDEPGIVQSARAMCERWGMQVIGADSLAALLPALGDEAPDVIVTDYRLRDEQTGLALIEALRARWPRQPPLPAALLTGDTETELLPLVQARNIQVIYKPISAAGLAESLRALAPAARPPAPPASGS